jgi:hypothetical protein
MRIPLLLIGLMMLQNASSQNTYEIKANIKPFNKGYYYLAYHFGNKQYLIDSAKVAATGDAVFAGTKKLQGGIYMIVFPQKNGWVECMIDQQQKFSVFADTTDLVMKLRYEGSPDNTVFGDYQKKSFEIGSKMGALRNQLNATADPMAKAAIQADMTNLSKEMQTYRDGLQVKYPKHLLTSIFHLLKDPEVPTGDKHPGGKYDSVYAYNFYKEHYWDGIKFTDDRLIRTPVLQGKFDRYYDEVLPQQSDSLIQYADKMLAASKPSEEMFKYVL